MKIAYVITKPSNQIELKLECPSCKNSIVRWIVKLIGEIYHDRCGLCGCEFNYTINKVNDDKLQA